MIFLKEAKKDLQKHNAETQDIVSKILSEIKNNGDESLRLYEEKFGDSKRDGFRLTEEEINSLINELDQTTKELIERTVSRIKDFAEEQLNCIKPLNKEFGAGIRMGHNIIPIEKVGAYVPGGRYPLLSSGPMVVAPAKIAGVKKIIACSPANFKGSIHPAIVYGLMLSGADEIYGVGGAQAIAAMAYGTETIPQVDFVSGPGNKFVAEAKRQVFGEVGIDMIAGPSEVVVLADENSNPEWCSADLLAQAEHDPSARAILISTSKKLAERVMNEITKQIKEFDESSPVHESWSAKGEIIVTDSTKELIEISDEIAGEHVHIHFENTKELEEELSHYGSLFINENSTVVFSDKVSGPNHTLPTDKSARFTGGLWVGSYLKIATFQEINGAGVSYLADHSVKQSNIEGLHGHKTSAKYRLNQ